MWNRPGTRVAALWPWLFAISPILAGGCGNLTAGGGSGRVSISLAADADFLAGARASAPAARALVSGSDDDDDEPEGEVEVEFDLFLVSASGEPTQLNEDEIRARMDLRGRGELDVVERVVAAASYHELRIVFRAIEAEIEGGLIVNGVPVTGEVSVEIDDASIVVSRPIDLDLEDGESASLLVDLNAAAWLQAVDPATRTVDATAFANRIQVIER